MLSFKEVRLQPAVHDKVVGLVRWLAVGDEGKKNLVRPYLQATLLLGRAAAAEVEDPPTLGRLL